MRNKHETLEPAVKKGSKHLYTKGESTEASFFKRKFSSKIRIKPSSVLPPNNPIFKDNLQNILWLKLTKNIFVM